MECHGDPPSVAVVPGAAAAAAPVPEGSTDRLSGLPDHLLARILLWLPTLEAVQTSVLSRRWRGVWAQLSDLEFHRAESSVPAHALAVYRANGGLDINRIAVSSDQMDAQPSTDWLSLAAPRVAGVLCFHNSHNLSREYPAPCPAWLFLHDDVEEVVMRTGEVVLPCFKKATVILMDLGFLGLALPPAGVFDALSVMHLEQFWYRGEFVISDTMLPSLRELTIHRVRALTVLTLNSNSVLDIHLSILPELKELSIYAAALEDLHVTHCFDAVEEEHAAIIDAEGIKILRWEVPFVPEAHCLRKMSSLFFLGAPPISTLWPEDICAEFINCFPVIQHLELQISLGLGMDGSLLWMESIRIPNVNVLSIYLATNGHVFEGRVLQLLTGCSGIRQLNLSFQARDEMNDFCFPDCICGNEPEIWGDEVVPVRGLEKVEIVSFHGAPREVYLVEQLVLRAPDLRSLKVISKVEDHSLEGIECLCPRNCSFDIFLIGEF